MEQTDKLARIRAYCAAPPHAVLFDEPSAALFDVFSAKTLALNPGALRAVEEANDKQSAAPYLRLTYEDGHVIGLSQAGVAYAPSTANTGPLPGLPEAVCFRDFRGALDQLKHQLYGHPDQAPTRDTLRLVLTCIAILEGARAAGFDVSREEPEVEVHLAELERRAPPA